MLTQKPYLITLSLVLTILLLACGSGGLVQPAQEPATPTPQASEPTPVPLEAKPQPETSTPTPPPTETVEPTPIALEPITPTIPTTPISPFEVVSDEPLLSDDLLWELGIDPQDRTPVLVVDWPTPDEVIVGVGPYGNQTYWRVSISQQQAELTTWQYREPSAAVIEEMSQVSERVREIDWALQVSPDGRWATWGFTQTLWLKELGSDNPPQDLMDNIPFVRPEVSSNTLAWSVNNNQVAYLIKNGPLHRYEIRITNIFTNQRLVVPLGESPAFNFAWSPDGNYMVFNMLAEPQSGIENMYLIEVGQSTPTLLLTSGLVQGDIRWSSRGNEIIYTHGRNLKPWVVKLKYVSESK